MRNISNIYVGRRCIYKLFNELIKSGSNIQLSILGFHNELNFSQKKHQEIFSNIYVSIFDKYIKFWSLMYIWMIELILYVSFYNILFKNNTIKIAKIYVSITGYLLQQINTHQFRKNIQHYVSSS